MEVLPRTKERDAHVRAYLEKSVAEAKAHVEAGYAPPLLLRYREVVLKNFNEGKSNSIKWAYYAWECAGYPTAG